MVITVFPLLLRTLCCLNSAVKKQIIQFFSIFDFAINQSKISYIPNILWCVVVLEGCLIYCVMKLVDGVQKNGMN